MSEINLKTIKFEGLAGTYVLPDIPEVSTEDDGKLLKVVDGAWTAVKEDEISLDGLATEEYVDEKISTIYIVSETAPSDTSLLWLKPVS